jgi:hypothetical protein
VADLTDYPPPRRGAKEGFYPDPLGSGRARWWDGSAWTMRVGPVVPPDSPQGSPVGPPTKRCRHCGAESETFGDKCLNCGRSFGTSPGVIAAIVAGSIVAVILLLGGCGLLIAGAIDEVGDEIDEDSITRAQFDSVQPGDTEASVRKRLGDPLSEDTFAGKNLECIYYAQKDEGLFGLDDFELCFRNGLLVRKSFN